MNKENRDQKEIRLNEQLSSCYSEEDAFDRFEYLTNPDRGDYITDVELQTRISNHMLGTTLREYDPIAFETAD